MESQNISYLEFEGLAARFFTRFQKVTGVVTLLQETHDLLESQVALLLQRKPGSPDTPDNIKVVKVYPENKMDWAREHLQELRWWTSQPAMETDHPGVSREDNLRVGDLEFFDTLVAFSDVPPRKTKPKYELILLKDKPPRYSTYHSTLAAAMLWHYESMVTRINLARVEHTKDAYAAIIGQQIMKDCTWDEFHERVEQYRNDYLVNAQFMGSTAVLLTAYLKWRNSEPQKMEEIGKPLQWLDKDEHKDDDRWKPYRQLTRFIKDESPWSDDIHKAALSIVEEKKESHLKDGVTEDNNKDFHIKAALVVLEGAWRQIREAASTDGRMKDRLPDGEQCSKLLEFTNKMVLNQLLELPKKSSTASSKKFSASSGENPQELRSIGRKDLRLYFAHLIIHASRLRNRYLWIPDDGENQNRRVQADVRREFLLNLSRFMLDVVGILQKANYVNPRPQAISTVEALDGLLYMVDRYAHVEMQVDERLYIREHLGRCIGSEVSHHLVQRYYRDHLLHVIDVFLLGHLLLHTTMNLKSGEARALVEHISALITEDVTKGVRTRLPEQWLTDWAVASLLHDIGYQLSGPPSRGLDDPIAAAEFFSLTRPSRLPWPAMNQEGDKPWRERLEELVARFSSPECPCWWLPSPNSFDLADHGVLSALRVAQCLVHADNEDKLPDEALSLELVLEYRESLHAIVHHNLFKHEVKFAKNPLSALLRLCDELQEWGRPKVNIEAMVKRIYLQIEQDEMGSLEGTEILDDFLTNIQFSSKPGEITTRISSRLTGNSPTLIFLLKYNSPVKANYDAIMTFLSKAYNLQHVHLSMEKTDGSAPFEWRLEMEFPQPEEYRGITELDIYGQIRERVRVLPELWSFGQIPAAGSGGLIQLGDPPQVKTNNLCIIVRGVASKHNRYGWQTCHPGQLRKKLEDLKRELLTGRILGTENRWLSSYSSGHMN